MEEVKLPPKYHIIYSVRTLEDRLRFVVCRNHSGSWVNEEKLGVFDTQEEAIAFAWIHYKVGA